MALHKVASQKRGFIMAKIWVVQCYRFVASWHIAVCCQPCPSSGTLLTFSNLFLLRFVQPLIKNALKLPAETGNC